MVDRDRTVVLGLGNILCGDEGFGVVALLAVRAQVGHIPGVDWLDGGVMGLDLLPVVESSSRLLILDAIDTGMDPGSLIEFDKGDIPLFGGIKLSEHQVSFQEVLALARFRQSLPEHLRLIGQCSGAQFAHGSALEALGRNQQVSPLHNRHLGGLDLSQSGLCHPPDGGAFHRRTYVGIFCGSEDSGGGETEGHPLHCHYSASVCWD